MDLKNNNIVWGLFVIYFRGVGDFQPIQAYEKFTPPLKGVF